jgi:dienelactone hydrolase
MECKAVLISPLALPADVTIPEQARGVVIFAHGSGSSRFSPRNRYVAQRLNQVGLATVLMDLLTAPEEQVDLHTRQFRFDIPLLAERLSEAADWVSADPDLGGLPMGYFGASTGAAAALVAAVHQPRIQAVVSRGGRPDLAGQALALVRCPTLLIVGSLDTVVLELNRRALEELRCEKRLVIVENAGHLFEEPGALERVADLSIQWFLQHLGQQPPA